MNESALISFMIILFTAMGVLFICGKLKIPSVIGFLFTGIILGPHGMFDIGQQHITAAVSEVGIILMLFTIGLEFSIDDLIKRKRVALLGGAIQIGLTSVIFTGIFWLFDVSIRQALFYSFLLTLSSTAVVIKLFTEKRIMDSIVGKNSLSLLIFQDIFAVLVIVFLPLFDSSPSGDVSATFLALKILTGIGILIGLFVVARYVIPPMLFQILKLRNRELFLLTIILIITGITVVCSELGLSVGLGAFLAGLVISDSDYSNYTLSHIIPFQDLFTSLFFISVGFLFDLGFVINNIGTVLGLLAIVLAVKILVLYPTVVLVGQSSISALITAFSLSQVGEFSIIIAAFGNELGLIAGDDYGLFIALTLISMALTPILIFTAQKICSWESFKRFSNFIDTVKLDLDNEQGHQQLKDHLLIVGFGITGKLHARICQKLNLPYVVVEMNPLTVKHEKKKGMKIYHGDASSVHLLNHLQAAEARMAIVSVPDYAGTLKIIKALRSANPRLYIIARCPHIFEMEELLKNGADKAVAVELESSLEILSSTMSRYFVAGNEIDKNLEEIRSGFYKSSRGALKDTLKLSDVGSVFNTFEMQVFNVTENSDIAGKSLMAADMRSKFQISMLAYKRDDTVIPNPNPDYVFAPGDFVMLFGKRENLIEYAANHQLV